MITITKQLMTIITTYPEYEIMCDVCDTLRCEAVSFYGDQCVDICSECINLAAGMFEVKGELV